MFWALPKAPTGRQAKPTVFDTARTQQGMKAAGAAPDVEHCRLVWSKMRAIGSRGRSALARMKKRSSRPGKSVVA
jgi:hypothetical protein